MNDFLELKAQAFKLSHYSCLVIEGKDAVNFLNSQTTNDVKKLADNSFQFDTLLDISGRVESFFIELKKNSELIYLLVPTDILSETIERIEKFHIVEDFVLKRLNEIFSIHFFNNQIDGFKGLFGSMKAQILKNQNTNSILDKSLHTLFSTPFFNETIKTKELINNTLLKDIALDLSKGCFLGQETVAKVETRRGAAIAPIFLVSDEKLDIKFPYKLNSMSKKIGEVLDGFEFEGRFYYLAFLNRENRISNKEVFIDYKDKQIGLKTKDLGFVTQNYLVEGLYQKAVIDFQQGKEDRAIEKLKRVIEVDKNFYDAYESLGVIYGRQEKFEEAIKVMHKLESIHPKSVMAQTNLSMFYMKIGEIETAEKHKSNATINQFEAFGEEAEIKRKKEAQEKREKEDKEKRESMFKQVLEIDPLDPLASFGLGEFRLEEQKYDEAIELLNNAIKGDKKYSVAYLALGKAYLAKNNIQKAKEVLALGIKIASKNGDLMPANEMQSLVVSI